MTARLDAWMPRPDVSSAHATTVSAPVAGSTPRCSPWREIVGVSADVKQVTLQDEPAPMYFVPCSQGLITTPHLVIRSADTAVVETARRVVAEADRLRVGPMHTLRSD